MKQKSKVLVISIFVFISIVLNNGSTLANNEQNGFIHRYDVDLFSFFNSREEYLEWMLPERGSAEYQARIRAKNAEMEELKNLQHEMKSILSNNYEHIIQIPGYTQITDSYCVPAACQNIIQTINGSSPDQNTLAINMNTTSQGTSASNAASELQRQTGLNYEVGIIDEQPFYEHIKTDINAGYPVILFVWYSLYKPGEPYLGHALVCCGYDSYYNTVLCYDVLYGTYRWDTIQTIANAAFYYIY